MGRRKTPQQKKAESYAKDRVYYGGFVRRSTSHAKPRRRHRLERTYRHEIDARLRPDRLAATLEVEVEEALGIRRKPLLNWGPERLGAHIRERQHQRAIRTASRLFRKAEDPGTKRERFTRFLAQITTERTAGSRRVAELFRHALAPKTMSVSTPDRFQYGWWGQRGRREWLAAFFIDEPEWEARLRAWIAELLTDEPAD